MLKILKPQADTGLPAFASDMVWLNSQKMKIETPMQCSFQLLNSDRMVKAKFGMGSFPTNTHAPNLLNG